MFTAPRSTAEDVATRLAGWFDLLDCWYEAFPFDVQFPRLEPGRVVLPAAEPGVGAWKSGAIELPVRAGGLTIGRFVLVPRSPTCGVAWSPHARAAAIACVDAVASAIATEFATD
jgi:hypothetical protein